MSDDALDWFGIGHTTWEDDRTGCTAIVFDQLQPAVVDVRGGSPGTRETELLQVGRLVGKVDALLLTGGSAFGLSAADGVMRWLEEQGRGIPMSSGAVPIVPAAVIFDLSTGTTRRPTIDDGYAAAAGAARAHWAAGPVGAGTGATVAKLGGRGPAARGGIGISTVQSLAGSVTAVVALNAVGDVRDPESGVWLARTADPGGAGRLAREIARNGVNSESIGENTTIGALLISAEASRDALHRCCVAAHDALARCVVPAHTLFDGDTFFAVAREDGNSPPAHILALAAAAEVAVERAIVSIFGR